MLFVTLLFYVVFINKPEVLKKYSKWGSGLVDYIGKHIHKHSVIGWFAYFVVILGILVGITLVGYYFSLGVEENKGISQFIGMSGLFLTLLGTSGIFITLYRVSSLGMKWTPEVDPIARTAFRVI